jgi:hypothetical protein
MNMAIDEALLEHATVASIRFYRWHSPALSFGYFGRFADVGRYAAECDLVRRWTGGGTVFLGMIGLHCDSPRDPVWRIFGVDQEDSSRFSHALAAMGGHAQLAFRFGDLDRRYRGACFANPVRADVIVKRISRRRSTARTRAGLLHQGIQGRQLRQWASRRFAKVVEELQRKNVDNELLDRAREIAGEKCHPNWLQGDKLLAAAQPVRRALNGAGGAERHRQEGQQTE